MVVGCKSVKLTKIESQFVKKCKSLEEIKFPVKQDVEFIHPDIFFIN